MIQWWRNRRAAKAEAWWRQLVNGHDFETTQYEANKPIIITCRHCGYEHMDVWPEMAPWAPQPWYPVETPCPSLDGPPSRSLPARGVSPRPRHHALVRGLGAGAPPHERVQDG